MAVQTNLENSAKEKSSFSLSWLWLLTVVLSSSVDTQSFEIYVCVHECACENLLINMLACENDTIKTKKWHHRERKVLHKIYFKKTNKKTGPQEWKQNSNNYFT